MKMRPLVLIVLIGLVGCAESKVENLQDGNFHNIGNGVQAASLSFPEQPKIQSPLVGLWEDANQNYQLSLRAGSLWVIRMSAGRNREKFINSNSDAPGKYNAPTDSSIEGEMYFVTNGYREDVLNYSFSVEKKDGQTYLNLKYKESFGVKGLFKKDPTHLHKVSDDVNFQDR